MDQRSELALAHGGVDNSFKRSDRCRKDKVVAAQQHQGLKTRPMTDIDTDTAAQTQE